MVVPAAAEQAGLVEMDVGIDEAGQTSLPPTSISAASQARWGSIAAIRPPAMPISTGSAEARVLALRKIRSKAVFAFMDRAGWRSAAT